jgi:hypothetical protein
LLALACFTFQNGLATLPREVGKAFEPKLVGVFMTFDQAVADGIEIFNNVS